MGDKGCRGDGGGEGMERDGRQRVWRWMETKGVEEKVKKGCRREWGQRVWRGMGEKGVEGDRGKGCGGGWRQRVWRGMGTKGVGWGGNGRWSYRIVYKK